jgi:hypothetical protein
VENHSILPAQTYRVPNYSTLCVIEPVARVPQELTYRQFVMRKELDKRRAEYEHKREKRAG